jgi:hypothetical protein
VPLFLFAGCVQYCAVFSVENEHSAPILGNREGGFSLFSVLKSWLLKEFLFLGKILVTYSEVVAFYMRAEASSDAGKASTSLG